MASTEDLNCLVRRLATECVSGSKDASTDLNTLLSDRLAGPLVCRQLKGRPTADVDDILQEVRAAVFQNIKRLADADLIDSPAGWICRTATLQVRLYFRKERIRERRDERHRVLLNANTEPASADTTRNVEEEEVLARLIDKLPSEEERAFLRLRIAGLSLEAIRTQMGLSERKARRLQQNIREVGLLFYPERSHLTTHAAVSGGERHD